MAADSKTEKATPKKREDERKKGNIFLSKDIMSSFSLIITFFSLKILFPYMYKTITGFFYTIMDYAGTQTQISDTFSFNILMELAIAFFKSAMPLMLITTLTAVIMTFAQTRMAFTASAIMPKFSRLNPLNGIKNLFSLRSFIDIIKGLLKISIICIIIYKFIFGKLGEISNTLTYDLNQSSIFVLKSIIDLVINVSIVFIFLSCLDYFYQWWEYERQIKMSKQEIKEEYKQIEGDPQVKGKLKENQRKLAMSRMMQAVPKADVIVRNPTHFAVALKYDIDKDNAPKVIAKGQDEVALRIVKVAEENNVYVVENVPLARAIYAASEINDEIPMEYYSAVAEILAFVFKLKNKTLE